MNDGGIIWSHALYLTTCSSLLQGSLCFLLCSTITFCKLRLISANAFQHNLKLQYVWVSLSIQHGRPPRGVSCVCVCVFVLTRLFVAVSQDSAATFVFPTASSVDLVNAWALLKPQIAFIRRIWVFFLDEYLKYNM